MTLKLKFNLEQWLSHEMLKCLPLQDIDPNGFHGEPYQKKVINENADKKILSEFRQRLKKTKDENKELIRQKYIHSEPFPFPELIEAPELKHIYSRIISNLEKIENRELYCTLLRNNDIPVYQSLVEDLSSEHKSRKNIFFSYSVHNGEDYYLGIFKHAILICPPAIIQSTFECLAEEYKKLDKIDSKEKVKQKEEEIRYGFHKSLRQADPLGNSHVEMIIHNLMNITDLPHRAIKTVIEHVKELKKEKTNECN